MVTEAEGVCAQSVKAEKSRTKETEVRVLILSGILALHFACQALASCSLHTSRFHFVAVLLEVVQPVLGVPIEGADTRIKTARFNLTVFERISAGRQRKRHSRASGPGAWHSVDRGSLGN